MMSPEALRAEAESHIWFHSIDLGNGVVSEGIKSQQLLADELGRIGLDDNLDGQSVLDIGAWDGYFSFEAERRGAKRVVALDHYAWALDHKAQRHYWEACQKEGRPPLPYEAVPHLWDEKRLPGRAPFELAKRCLGSRVDAVVGDFMTMDLAQLGQFDIVLFLGVLYHLEDPLRALRRLRRVTQTRAIIETVCGIVPDAEDQPMWFFFPSDELNGDPSNWWAPNLAGLIGMCKAAGFGEVRVRCAPAPTDPPNPGYQFHFGRCVVDAFVAY